MPAPKVRADYDQLSKIAQLFNQEAESTERTLRDMTQRMQVLQGGDWIGEGAQAFYTEMDQGVVPAFRRLINALREASQVTQSINGLMKETEQSASSTFKKGASRVSSGRSAEGMSAAGGAGTAGAGAMGTAGATVGAAAAAAGASAGASASAASSGSVPSWLSNLLGTNGSSQSQTSGDLLDQFTNELHQVRDSLATSSTTDANASDSDFPSQQILDAVKNDLASQSQLATNGWQQAGEGAGGGSGGSPGSGSGGGGSGAGRSTGGGGGGGSGSGSSPSLSGGGLGSGSSSQVSGQQGIVSSNAATGGGSGGGMFGGGDGAGSFGAAVVAGITRSASGAGAPLAQVILTVGASAGGLLFATKGGQSGGVGGWATGQFAQNAASPIYRAARG